MNLLKSLFLIIAISGWILGCATSGADSLDDLGTKLFHSLRNGDVGSMKKLRANEKEIIEAFGEEQMLVLTGTAYNRQAALSFNEKQFNNRSNYLQQEEAEYMRTSIFQQKDDVAEIGVWCKRGNGSHFVIRVLAYNSDRGWLLVSYV